MGNGSLTGQKKDKANGIDQRTPDTMTHLNHNTHNTAFMGAANAAGVAGGVCATGAAGNAGCFGNANGGAFGTRREVSR